jgi:predicted  nucleic acid-binding Zn-ribbon protein
LSNTTFHLFQLQKIDQAIRQVLRELSENHAKQLDISAIQTIENELQSSISNFNQTQEQYLELENSISKKKIKLSQSDSSLYGGLIKSPKELQDLQNEIACLKKGIQSLEDLQLEKLVEVESNEQVVSALQLQLDRMQRDRKTDNSKLETEENLLNIELNRLKTEKLASQAQIPSEFLSIYNSLLLQKNGLAVGIVEDGSCLSCGNMLTPADCQIAKSQKKIFTCPNCGRILYAG